MGVQSGLDQVRTILKSKNSFILAGHTTPDGDSIGACLALALALKKAGKEVTVLLEPYFTRFSVIPGQELLYTGEPDDLSADVFLCLDCADATRLGKFIHLLNRARLTACIDHHVTNEGFCTFNFIDGGASSTSELVYRMLDGEFEMDVDVASAIYAGIISDTDGLRFSSVNAETLRVVGCLIEMGIPFTDIYTKLLRTHTYAEGRLLGKLLEASVRQSSKRVVSSCVTREMMKSVKATTFHLEGAVEFLLNTKGAEVAILLYEKKEPSVKISLRSRNIDVSEIAAALGGGGHTLAAGAVAEGDIIEIRNRVLGLVNKSLKTYDKEKAAK
ncbi:MAG: bifunctional oligoribonuclease/PAP phosphatase NrnA [Clostridiales bacterium]|jgi:phosphoesterase RecJ-like protein|nr:bifunctional oligoribonuclease/PAP phosphatase NrnA [Clostridiales bacterium]